MEHNPTPLSKDDLQKINTRIKELTEMIAASESSAYIVEGKVFNNGVPSVVEGWNKELRRLRRQRDANDKIQP